MMGFMSVWMFVGLLLLLVLMAGAVYVGIRLTNRDEDRRDPPGPA